MSALLGSIQPSAVSYQLSAIRMGKPKVPNYLRRAVLGESWRQTESRRLGGLGKQCHAR